MSVSFFNKYLKKHKVTVLFIILTAIFSFTFEFINPLIFRIIIDNIFIGKEFYLLNYIILIIISFFIVSSITGYFNTYLTNKLEYNLYKEMSVELFDKILNSSVKNHESNNVGDLMARIMGNVQLASKIVPQILLHMFMNLLLIFIPLAIMFYFNFYLTVVIVSPCILFLFLNVYMGKKIEIYESKVLKINGVLSSFLKEFLSVFLMLKVFNLKDWVNKKFEGKNKEYYNMSLKSGKVMASNYSLNFIFFALVITLFIIFGGRMVIDDSVTIGTFTAFLTYINMFFSPMAQISLLWSEYKSSLPVIDRINEIKEIKIENLGDKKLNITNGEIFFNNVDFSHENNKILENFTVQFSRGLNYIVGDNGTGKSTIMQLICGLYNVNEGEITIDKQNIDSLDPESLLNNIAIVFSYPYLFKGSIYENILVGNLEASKEEIDEVCRLVELDEFISSKEEGYDYDVGEAGQFLSSGEGQKVALARAIIKNSPILLLDEVTKSIDEETRNILSVR
ncbi:MAG: ABC transporter ATP-binding protein/permease [Methanobrevibacter sp.]|jgi:ABC-type bacteriocin/lantibiotic exporter with double-glycine peptidase domain|nr:ABC transporter ATP-binding protein/permease [Candidatus Methanovirga procula]